MTNFESLTRNIGAFAMFIDKNMARPYKCACCTRMNSPSCPVGVKCYDHILAWLGRQHEEAKK